MSPKERESEIKSVSGKGKATPPKDPNLVGGECVETPEEKEGSRRERQKPKTPPIIQKDVT